jgi:epoxyqueuosine reductase
MLKYFPLKNDLLKQKLKQKAIELGFFEMRVAKAEHLDKEAYRLEQWLKKDYNGSMNWMEKNIDLRLDPRKLVPGARTVIVFAFNYYTDKNQTEDSPKISKYAYGRDYHKVLKSRLKKLIQWIGEEIGDIQGRAFVDSAPVMERAWAEKSGLGWIGKHSLSLTKQKGSFYFLATLISDLDLSPDAPTVDHCGTCTRCIDACPTHAIVQPYVVDAKRCISYLTIEYKEKLPLDLQSQMEGWAFGCDICQDVCPWNRFSKQHQEPDFEPKESLLAMNNSDWQEITEEVFQKLFEGSAVKRTGFEGLKRNIEFLKK